MHLALPSSRAGPSNTLVPAYLDSCFCSRKRSNSSWTRCTKSFSVGERKTPSKQRRARVIGGRACGADGQGLDQRTDREPPQPRSVGAARVSRASWSRSLLRQEKQGCAQGPWHNSSWAWVGLPEPLERAALQARRGLLGLCVRAARARPRLQGSWAPAGESGRLRLPQDCSAGAVGPPQPRSQRVEGCGRATTEALPPGPPGPLTETAPRAAATLRIPRSLSASSCAQKPDPWQRRSTTARPGGGITEMAQGV